MCILYITKLYTCIYRYYNTSISYTMYTSHCFYPSMLWEPLLIYLYLCIVIIESNNPSEGVCHALIFFLQIWMYIWWSWPTQPAWLWQHFSNSVVECVFSRNLCTCVFATGLCDTASDQEREVIVQTSLNEHVNRHLSNHQTDFYSSDHTYNYI